MVALSYAPWRPDVANLNSPFLKDVRNTLLAANSYIPFPTLQALTDPLTETPTGGITIRDSTGTVHIFVGTTSKLFKLNNSDLTWDHVSKLGADQVVNGTFDADTDWTKDAGVTIGGGVASFTAVADGDGLSQAQSLTAGTIYKIVFTVSNFSVGGLLPMFTGGTQVDGTEVNADGTFTQYLTAVSGNNAIEFQAVGSTTLDIDNVTIEPLTNYNSTAQERWRFAQFGDFVVAVNINTAPQVYEIGVSAEFDDLAGSPPQVRHIAVWGDHLALMNERTVTWSDTNDITNWTTGNSDSQTFPDGGDIQGSSDSTNPVIIQKRAIRVGTFVPGSTLLFTFQKTRDGRGAAAPYSITHRDGRIFFADAGGFYMVGEDGFTMESIGFEKVDRNIFMQIGGADLAAIYGEVDPFHTRVYWAVKISSTSNAFDRLLVYDWGIGEWTQIDTETEMDILFPLASGTIGYTLDNLTDLTGFSLDDLPFSLDSNVWQGGAPVLGAFGTDNALGFFSGVNAEAFWETSEVGSTSGEVTFMDGIEPITDTNDVFVAIGSRFKRGDNVVWSEEKTPNDVTGRVDHLNEARFHAFRKRIPEGTEWTHSQGVDIGSMTAGKR